MNFTKNKQKFQKNKFRKKGDNNFKPAHNRRKVHFKTKPMVEELKRINKNNDTTETREDKTREKKMGVYKKAFAEYERIKAQKKQERENLVKRKMEIKESLEKYEQKKRDKFKKLSAKTKKGQPIMKNRIEMLLEKIQSS